MTTTWEFSPQTEAQRLIHSAHQIVIGFYKANGFLVLPPSFPQDSQTISFPDLPYTTIPRFWDRCKKINIGTKLPLSIPDELINPVVALLEKNPFPKPDFSVIQNTWSADEKAVLNIISDLSPSQKNWIKNIHIYPTAYGSITSFNCLEKPGDVHIWLRADASVSNIVEGLLSCLIYMNVVKKLDFTWSESEAVTDWLLAYSPLAPLLKRLDPNYEKVFTLKSTRNKQRATLMHQSQEYLKHISAPLVDISYIKNADISNFSSREKQLFELLVNHSPRLVTIDEIADTLYTKNPDEFSLYAISKSIQRLRDKLEQNGISGSFIQTKRGEGYLLAN